MDTLWDALVRAVHADDAMRAKQVALRLRAMIDAEWTPITTIR